jgi:hypothetical protein
MFSTDMKYLSHAVHGVATPFHREQLLTKLSQIDQDAQYIGNDSIIQILRQVLAVTCRAANLKTYTIKTIN